MTTKQIPIAQATASELADFATAHLGLEVNYRHGAASILAKMQTAGYTKDFIEVETADAVDPNARVASAAPEPRQTVIINIQNQPGAGGKDHVPVGVNGKVYRIMRGKDVEVPVEVLRVLQTAKTTQYDRGPNGEPINPTDVLKHPFSIVRGVAA